VQYTTVLQTNMPRKSFAASADTQEDLSNTAKYKNGRGHSAVLYYSKINTKSAAE
jgi:hypothetical protein